MIKLPRIQSRHWMLLGAYALLFMISYTSVMSELSTDLQRVYLFNTAIHYSDGIYYLLLDVVCVVFLFLMRGIKVNSLYLISLLLAFMPVFSLFILGNKDAVLLYAMRGMTWALLLISLCVFVSRYPMELDYISTIVSLGLLILSIIILYIEFTIRSTGVTIALNTVYWVELGLPMVFITKNKFIKYITLSSIALCVFLSLKATGIFALAFALIVAIYYSYNSSKRVISSFVFITILLFVIYLLWPSISDLAVKYLNVDWTEKLTASIETGGSSRTEIWGIVLEAQFNSDFFAWFLGHGYSSTMALTNGFTAHNDFLEILYDFGLLGFSVYVSLYWYICKKFIAMRNHKSSMTVAFGVSISLFFVFSFFSHLIIYPQLLLNIGIVWAMCIAIFNNEKRAHIHE